MRLIRFHKPAGVNMYKPLRLIIAIATALVLTSCSVETKPVRLGVAKQPSSALVHIALAKNYFKEAGLDVKPSYYASGKRALLDGFIPGHVDYFDTADAPFVDHSFTDSDIVALAKIYTSDNVNRIVARKDRGIENVRDLKGKTIATQENSAVHYFMHAVFLEYAIPHESMNIKFFPGKELPQKLIDGEIDAFSMREPYVSQAIKALGANATVIAAPGVYIQSDVLVSSRKTINADPQVAQRLISGLLMAQDFAMNNPDEAINIVAKAIGSSPEAIRESWNTYDLSIGLDQSMLIQLTSVGQWIASEVKVGMPMPDFLKHIDSAPLKAVRPERASIIGG